MINIIIDPFVLISELNCVAHVFRQFHLLCAAVFDFLVDEKEYSVSSNTTVEKVTKFKDGRKTALADSMDITVAINSAGLITNSNCLLF